VRSRVEKESSREVEREVSREVVEAWYWSKFGWERVKSRVLMVFKEV
jgi:hypothetical protein